jgi:hypothetical protein
MPPRTDAATEAFLESARADLQRQLASTAHVKDMAVEVQPDRTVVRAWIAVAEDVLVLVGSGESVLDAYRDLIHSASPSIVLASAYRQVLEERLR